MPMSVRQRTTPATTWAIASSPPGRMIQMMLPTRLVPASASRDGTATRPNGHRAKLASLKAERDRDDQQAGDHACDQVEEREPPAGEDEPQDVAGGLHGRLPTKGPTPGRRQATRTILPSLPPSSNRA